LFVLDTSLIDIFLKKIPHYYVDWEFEFVIFSSLPSMSNLGLITQVTDLKC
jgi:hypothetical protein